MHSQQIEGVALELVPVAVAEAVRRRMPAHAVEAGLPLRQRRSACSNEQRTKRI